MCPPCKTQAKSKAARSTRKRPIRAKRTPARHPRRVRSVRRLEAVFVGYDQTRRARSRRSAVGRVLSERPHDQHLGNIVLHVTRPEWLGTVLAIATGSPSHVVQLQELAERNGLGAPHREECGGY